MASKVVPAPRVEQTTLRLTADCTYATATDITTAAAWEEFCRWEVPAGLKSLMIKEGDPYVVIIRDNATTPVQNIIGTLRIVVLDFKRGNKRVIFEEALQKFPTMTTVQDIQTWPRIPRGTRVPPSWFLALEVYTAVASDKTVSLVSIPGYEEYPFP